MFKKNENSDITISKIQKKVTISSAIPENKKRPPFFLLLFRNPNRLNTKFIRLDNRNCAACWECINNCRQKVIGKVDFLGHRHSLIKNPDKCIGCLKCVKVCKFNAISQIQTNNGELKL
jgi:NAD-dependent dihydropyrimidine dehydrogenase PreA subunit